MEELRGKRETYLLNVTQLTTIENLQSYVRDLNNYIDELTYLILYKDTNTNDYYLECSKRAPLFNLQLDLFNNNIQEPIYYIFDNSDRLTPQFGRFIDKCDKTTKNVNIPQLILELKEIKDINLDLIYLTEFAISK